MNYLLNHYDDVLEMTAQHLEITLLSVLIAFIISFPLALLISRYKKLSPLVNGIVNAIFAIPSLALLVLLIPLTGLGTQTAVIALVLYNLYLLVKNISEGFDEVPPSLIEIGTGMGMSRAQIFFEVELPLAMPLIVSGLKLAFITTIAMATLGSVIGAGGLGTLIFVGLVTRHWNKVIIGTVMCVLIASVFTVGLSLLENYCLRVATGKRGAQKD